MKTLKKSMMLSIIAALLVAAMSFAPVSAEDTLFVNPSSIVDGTKIPGSTFTITVDIDAGVTNLWGYEFKLWYDTKVLTATLSTPSTDFPDVSMNKIDDNYKVLDKYYRVVAVKGLVWVSASLPMGTTVGLNGPRTLVTITFSVDDIGTSTLNIDESYTILMSAAGPPPIKVTIVDGYFANTLGIVALNTMFVETRRFSLTRDPEGLQTLTGLIKEMGFGWTKARVKFTVYDAEGKRVKELMSENKTIAPEQEITLSADLNVRELQIPASYSVEARVEYLDTTGTWVSGRKGSPEGARSTMTKSFTVEY